MFEGLPTTTIIAGHEVVELSVVFAGLGAVLCAVALLLGRLSAPAPLAGACPRT